MLKEPVKQVDADEPIGEPEGYGVRMPCVSLWIRACAYPRKDQVLEALDPAAFSRLFPTSRQDYSPLEVMQVEVPKMGCFRSFPYRCIHLMTLVQKEKFSFKQCISVEAG